MTGGSHSRGPSVTGRVRVGQAARAGWWSSWAGAAGLGRSGALGRVLAVWAAGVGERWKGEAGPREGWPAQEEEKAPFFFLFKKVLNQILHHIYKPKFDLLTCGYFKIYFLYHFWKQGIFS